MEFKQFLKTARMMVTSRFSSPRVAQATVWNPGEPCLTPGQIQAYEKLIRPREPADEWREQTARRLFPYETMSPEEYAAREHVNWGCFNFHWYRYESEKLDAWILRLHQIFRTPGLTEQYQQQFLTRKERRAINKRSKEEF